MSAEDGQCAKKMVIDMLMAMPEEVGNQLQKELDAIMRRKGSSSK
jgi:hypothetical protein